MSVSRRVSGLKSNTLTLTPSIPTHTPSKKVGVKKCEKEKVGVKKKVKKIGGKKKMGVKNMWVKKWDEKNVEV